MNEILNLAEIKALQRKMIQERDWDKFHTVKNLTMALAGEAGELLELFQWLNTEESEGIHKTDKKEKVEDEVADIFFYLVRLCDKLEINLEKAFLAKMEKSKLKYPIHLSKGSAVKYTELKSE